MFAGSKQSCASTKQQQLLKMLLVIENSSAVADYTIRQIWKNKVQYREQPYICEGMKTCTALIVS